MKLKNYLKESLVMNKTLILEKIKKHIQDFEDADNPDNPDDAKDELREACTLGEKYDIDYPKMYKIKKLFCGLFGSFNDKLEITVPTSFYASLIYTSEHYFEYNENNEAVTINCIPSTYKDKLYQHPFIIQLTNEGDNMEEKLIKLWETPSEKCTQDDYRMKCGNLLFITELINHTLLNCHAHKVTLITK